MEVNVTDGVADVADCGAFCFPMQIGNEFFFLFLRFCFCCNDFTFYLVLFAPYNEALTFL